MLYSIAITCLVLAAAAGGWCVGRRQAKPPSPPVPSGLPDLPEAGADWSTFVLGMSRELRTPLNGVIGFAELLDKADLPSPHRERVRLIGESGRMMLRLVNDILDFARMRAGQMRAMVEEADLVGEMQQVTALLRPIAAQQGVLLEVAIAQGFPDRIVTDRVRFRQIMLNLVGNALKHTAQGTVRITAEAHGQTVRLAVRDTGCGIAPDRLATLFVPFAWAVDDGLQSGGGTGLGLPICAEMARLMGGAITVESVPGTGSTFALMLPLRERAPAPDTVPTAARTDPRPGQAAPSHLAGCRILVAEDHEINQHLVMAMTASLGLEADLATNGREAVAMANTARQAGKPYALVLMDMQMPVMDGCTAARALREAGHSAQDLPIVALTASCLPQDVAAAREAGMQAHIAKPVVLADLAGVIGELIGARPVPDGADCDVTRAPDGTSMAIHGLDHRYRQRKREALARIGGALGGSPETVDWEAIAGDLHRLAGVAANFGDAPLGQASRRLERALRGTGDARQRLALLAMHWPDVEEAA